MAYWHLSTKCVSILSHIISSVTTRLVNPVLSGTLHLEDAITPAPGNNVKARIVISSSVVPRIMFSVNQVGSMCVMPTVHNGYQTRCALTHSLQQITMQTSLLSPVVRPVCRKSKHHHIGNDWTSTWLWKERRKLK